MDGFPAIYRTKGYFTSEIEVKWGLLSFKTKPHVIVGSSIWISLGAKDIKRQHIIICLDKGIVKVQHPATPIPAATVLRQVVAAFPGVVFTAPTAGVPACPPPKAAHKFLVEPL
ncbi:hypothetical protein RhiirB3_426140 [Rhizophagus irregularis]|nr:hypothetical protein RhiirB3_426140 [Rhizophagus irregularis]